MAPWSKKRDGRVNEALINQLGGELEDKYSMTKGTDRYFIHPEDAKIIMQREHIKSLFGSLPWYREDDRTVIWQHMSLILCILISMRWTSWGDFKALFFQTLQGVQRPRYTDRNLPLKAEQFPEHVPLSFSKRFCEYQFRFVPIFIRENSHLKYSTDHRLPILEVERLREAEGAQGVVEKIRIEKRFLHYNTQASNPVVSSLVPASTHDR